MLSVLQHNVCFSHFGQHLSSISHFEQIWNDICLQKLFKVRNENRVPGTSLIWITNDVKNRRPLSWKRTWTYPYWAREQKFQFCLADVSCVSSQKTLLIYILSTFRNNRSNNTTQNRLLITSVKIDMFTKSLEVTVHSIFLSTILRFWALLNTLWPYD